MGGKRGTDRLYSFLGMILHEISEMTAHKYTFDEILNCRDYEIFLEIVRENL